MYDGEERNSLPDGETRNVYQYIAAPCFVFLMIYIITRGYLNVKAARKEAEFRRMLARPGRGAYIGPAAGSCLPDISDDSKIDKRAWSKRAPEWRHAVDGLNLEGDCKNSACRAYKKRVIVTWGYRNDGVFDFFRNQQDCECPLCGSFVDPVNFAFTKTYYRVSGYKKDKKDGPFKDVKTPWHYAPNSYVTFHEREEDLVYWGKLKIQVKKDRPVPGKEIIYV
ncbi:hypothetical protein BDZ91DRAFT_734868 [Kalaharituber pfeilii]|nr:hypothetical protein BDZ91DRAFT_734868 [Kalaharituber pfeilii]